MKKHFGISGLLLLTGVAFAQENYSQWLHFRPVTINTTSGGANVTGSVTNFPLLVRLGSAQSDIFAQALSGGADVRFADSTGSVRLKYQKERWDSAGQVAEFWVLVPAIAGNATTTFRIYWGKNGAADSSKGASVFDTANGFAAVYHMNEPQGTGPQDATLNGLNFTARATVTRTPGQIDSARVYAGGTGGTPDSIDRNDKFNVTNMAFTLSAWVNRPAANTSQYEGIFSNWRYSSGAYRSYILEEKSNGAYAVQVSSDGVADTKIPQTSATFSNAAWHHVVGTMSSANGIQIYVDGVSQTLTGDAAAVAPFANTSAAARPLIGAMERANTQPFIGNIDEIELSVNTERSADWVKLSYESQKTGSTTLAFGSTVTLTVPGAPTGANATAGNGQATITWTAPSSNGGTAITGYTVTSNPGSLVCNTTGLTCSVTGLTNGTAYTFTVTATNAAGTSVASAASNSVTPTAPVGVPDAPTAVTAVSGNAQAAISWTAPASNGGSTITGYTATAAPGGATCTTTGALTCTVTGLTNGTSYTFSVIATNSAGNGPTSVSSSAVIPLGLPGAPTGATATPGNAQVIVSWTAPASNGGSAITSYTATAVSDTTKKCTTANGTTLTCTVTGLTNGTAYTFTVRATNAVGTSAASAQSPTGTPLTVPGAPTAATATAGAAQATISWTAPASNGGSVILDYTATASQDSSKHCTTSTLTCNVTNLSPGIFYAFTVTARNAAGAGPASVETGAITGILAFPKTVFAIHRSGSSMILRLPEISRAARVSILDLWGRTVWSHGVSAGSREIVWDRKAGGQIVSPGVYLVRIAEESGKPLSASKILVAN